MIETARTAPEATGADEVEEAVFMKMFIPKTLSEVWVSSELFVTAHAFPIVHATG
jgi:hypothetical protein